MPVATCVLTVPTESIDPSRIVDGWAARAGIGADEMTVNLVHARQGGKRYTATASLHLPSVWPERDVAALGTGLAAALAVELDCDLGEILVLTTVLTPGQVVEQGTVVDW